MTLTPKVISWEPIPGYVFTTITFVPKARTTLSSAEAEQADREKVASD